MRYHLVRDCAKSQGREKKEIKNRWAPCGKRVKGQICCVGLITLKLGSTFHTVSSGGLLMLQPKETGMTATGRIGLRDPPYVYDVDYT